MILNHTVLESIIDELPLGVFILNENNEIVFWNNWLEDKTKIESNDTLGKKLQELFPDMDTRRFDWAAEGAIKNNIPQLMSCILNEYLIKIKLDNNDYDNIENMQQQVKITPIYSDSGRYAAIMITDVTDIVVQKITLVQMAIRLEQDSYHDALTGAYNRRFMWEWLEKNICLGDKENFPIGCCMMDLDNFKKINDEYGHDRGDLVLKNFSSILTNNKRRSSIFVRLGGEEFGVFLPMADMERLRKFANKMHELLADSSIAGFDKGYITTSRGLSVWDPKAPVPAEELIKIADRCLYDAKDASRNCIRPLP